MKSLNIALVGILLSATATVFATTVSEQEANSLATSSMVLKKVDATTKQPEKVNRAKVVNIIMELELPDGSTVMVDNIDFCTPGGFYNGVEAVVFGDEAVRVMQAGMAALYPKVGDSINQLWENKSHANDPRLPTFLMIKPPENNLNAIDNKSKGDAKEPVTFGSSAKVFKLNDKTPIVMSSCGGYYHPDED